MRGLKKVCKGVRLRVSKHSMSAPWERRVWARVKETFALRARCRGVLWCGYDCSNAKYREPSLLAGAGRCIRIRSFV